MKIAVITGGSRGIGASTAEACADKGIGVVLTYKEGATAAARVVRSIQESGASAIGLKLDVSDVRSFSKFRDDLQAALRSEWERDDFDYLVNNAGYGLYNPIATVTEEQFDGLFAVHLKGPFFLTQTLLPLIAEEGQIVNVTSATTRVATAGVAPYASFKGGLEVLTRYMAKEFGPKRIRANAVAPGAIKTELGGGLNAEFEQLLASQTALGRVGLPKDVGGVIASLLSPENSWINAQTIEVAGGYII